MRTLLTILVLLAGSPALAQAPAAPSPRETTQTVATRIRDLYFDPRRGDEIAKGLESAATAGDFDTLTDPRDLAAALTTRLRLPGRPDPAGQHRLYRSTPVL
jgi:hypothetical protein